MTTSRAGLASSYCLCCWLLWSALNVVTETGRGSKEVETVGEQEMEMVTPPNYPVHFLHFDIYVHQIQTFHLKLGLVRKDLHWWRVAVLSIFANSTASQCGFR